MAKSGVILSCADRITDHVPKFALDCCSSLLFRADGCTWYRPIRPVVCWRCNCVCPRVDESASSAAAPFEQVRLAAFETIAS